MSFGSASYTDSLNGLGLGYNGLKVSLNYFDGLPVLQNIQNPELQIIFKSLLKRDNITKEKALNELLSLVKDDTKYSIFYDDIVVLSWCQMYAKLISSDSKIIRSQSHHFTSMLISRLKKSAAKFLKEMVPLMLSGIYDYDIAVSKSCNDYLLECFGSSEKVDSLWNLFSTETLNFIKEVILVESPTTISEEKYSSKQNVELRYNQLLLSSIRVLTKLISTVDISSENMEILHNIVSEKHLWSNLSLQDTKETSIFQALLHLMVQLRSKQLFRKNKEALKISSKSLLNSLSQVKARNLISLSSILPDILITLLDMNKYKDGKFWSYEKSSREHLKHFLSLGSGISNPIYYNLVYQLSLECSLLVFNEWVLIWQNFLKQEGERRILGRNGYKPLVQAWKYYIQFMNSISTLDEDCKMQQELEVTLLLNNKNLKEIPELIELLIKPHWDYAFLYEEILRLLPSGKEDRRKELLFISNACTILCETDISLIHQICSNIIDTLEANDQVDLISYYGFNIFDQLIKASKTDIANDIELFVKLLPTLVTVEFHEIPMKIMIDYCNTNFLTSHTWVEYLDDFILALSQLDIPLKQVLSFLDKLDNRIIETLLNSSQALNDLINDYVSNYKFEDDLIFKSKLLTAPLLLSLYEASKTQNKSAVFNKFVTELPETSIAYRNLLTESDFFYESLMLDHDFKIPHIVHTDEKIANRFVTSLTDTTLTDYLSDNEKIKEFVKQLSKDSLVTKKLLNLDFDSVFFSYIKELNPSTTLTAPFGLLPLALSQKGTPTADSYLGLIKLSKVVDSLLTLYPDESTTSNVIFLTRCYELMIDYNSLFDQQFTYFHKNTLYSRDLKIDFKDLLKCIFSEHNIDELGNIFDTKDNEVICFYNCRITYRISLNSIDYLSASQFEEAFESIEKKARKLLSSKILDVSSTLSLFAVICAAVKFNKSSNKLGVLRNYILSELVGVDNPSLDELRRFKILLLFLIQLLTFSQEDLETYQLEERRLNMALLSISKWMQSEQWYDDCYNEIRIIVLGFFEKLQHFANKLDLSERIEESTIQLLQDSIGFLEIEETPYYDLLRYEVFSLLNSVQNTISIWSIFDLSTIVDIAFKNMIENSRISNAYCNPLSKILKSLPTKEKTKIFDDLISVFFDRKLPLILMNVLLNELKSIIKEQQEELIVEYELSKASSTNLIDEERTTPNTITVEIPPLLIESLKSRMPHDYLEYQDLNSFMRYLNYCQVLIFYFDDVSYDIRQKYIQQLKEQDLINGLLDFLTDQMTLSYTKYWDNIDISDALAYPNSVDRGKLEPVDECNIMMEFLLYKFFTIFGSLVGQWWNNIKSRSFKDTVSNFVTRYISSKLIENELERTKLGLQKFDKNDLNLSIKVNKNNNEIKACYLIDDHKLEVAFKFPPNYPLQNVQVHGVSRVGVTEQQWKSWIISTQRIISNMNGSVVDSLELLSKNVKLQFSGFEECAICYFIIHAIDGKLPTKICPTCNNRFHGACLYKWFKSSGNNTCPLCRGEFNLRK